MDIELVGQRLLVKTGQHRHAEDDWRRMSVGLGGFLDATLRTGHQHLAATGGVDRKHLNSGVFSHGFAGFSYGVGDIEKLAIKKKLQSAFLKQVGLTQKSPALIKSSSPTLKIPT